MNTHVQKAGRDFVFNEAWAHIGFAQTARKGNSLGEVIRSLLIRAKNWLVASLRPIDAEEAYLSKAQNLADLERRIRIVQSPDCQDFFWRS